MAYTGKKPVDHTDVTQSQSMTVTDDLTVDTSTLKVDSANNRVGIGTTSPATALDVTGTVTADGLTVEQNVGSKVTLKSTDTTIVGGEVIGDIEFFSSDASGVGAAARANITVEAADAAGRGHMYFKTSTGGESPINRMLIQGGGDISFYEDTGTTAKLFWDASAERLGIGISSPTSKLQVYDNTGSLSSTKDITSEFYRYDATYNPRLQIRHSTTGSDINHTYSSGASNLTFSIGGTERMRIDSGGRLLVGTTSSANTNNGLRLKNSGTTTGNFSDAISSGHIEMCKNGNGFQGFMNCNYISTTGTGVIGFQNFSVDKGSIRWNSSGTSYNTASDYRLKENVTAITDGIERVKQLNPSRFNFISDPEKTVDGFLAHEAQTVVPEAITGTHNEVETWTQDSIDAGEAPANTLAGDNKLDDDGNTIPVYQNIDQAKLVPLLAAALKEAITKIEDLEARVATLEGN